MSYTAVFFINAAWVLTGCSLSSQDFWPEFELYLSDLFVGLTLDVVLVSLMAPVAVLGGASKIAMATGTGFKAGYMEGVENLRSTCNNTVIGRKGACQLCRRSCTCVNRLSLTC